METERGRVGCLVSPVSTKIAQSGLGRFKRSTRIVDTPLVPSDRNGSILTVLRGLRDVSLPPRISLSPGGDLGSPDCSNRLLL